MEWLLVLLGVLALLGLGSVAAVVWAAVMGVRALTRTSRTAIEAGRVRTQSLAVGPRGDVARVRLALRRDVEGVARSLAVARAQGWPVGDAPVLVERLEKAAGHLDARLDVLSREPDPRAVAGALPSMAAQADVLRRSAGALGLSLRSGGEALVREEIEALGADCDIEAQALQPAPPPSRQLEHG